MKENAKNFMMNLILPNKELHTTFFLLKTKYLKNIFKFLDYSKFPESSDFNFLQEEHNQPQQLKVYMIFVLEKAV